jgi:cell filamentation protein
LISKSQSLSLKLNMRDKYGVGSDKYCYPNSDTLINLLDIRDFEQLQTAEVEFTAERYRTYEPFSHDINDYSFEHLKQIHHCVFQDFCDWADTVRTADLAKVDLKPFSPSPSVYFYKLQSQSPLDSRQTT